MNQQQPDEADKPREQERQKPIRFQFAPGTSVDEIDKAIRELAAKHGVTLGKKPEPEKG